MNLPTSSIPMRFTGNPLNRSMININKKSATFLSDLIKSNYNKDLIGKWIIYRSNKIYFSTYVNYIENNDENNDNFNKNSNQTPPTIKYYTLNDILTIVNITNINDFIEIYDERIIVLGQEQNNDSDVAWVFSIDITSLSETELSRHTSSILDHTLALDGRKLLSDIIYEDSAICGLIRSLYSFHKVNQYLGSTGKRVYIYKYINIFYILNSV